MLNQNAIIIIDVNGNVLREPIGSFRANSNYTTSITVIAPFELNSVVSANYSKKNRKNDDIAQFLIPNGNKKGKDIIGENDPLYQLIQDWHVFEADVEQLAVAYFAKYRSDMLFVSIGVGNIVKPAKAITYKGEFGIDNLLPEVAENGDYYISKNYNFMDKNIQWTLNDYAYYDNGWKKSNYRGEAFTEPIELLVDPAIEANYEIQEDLDLSVLLAGRLAIVESRVNVISDQVDNHIEDFNNPHNVTKSQVGLGNLDDIKQATKTEFDAHTGNENNPHGVTAEQVDTYVKTTIDNKDANTLQEAKDYTYSQVEIDNKDTAIMNKANNLENANMLKDVNYNNVKGVLTFTRYDDTTKAIDLPLELLVESGYYDEVTNELVLVLANGSEIRIPVGNLLTDLDAHNIRFNGSGTNYLTAKTEVESAVKELDTRVKANADNKVDKVSGKGLSTNDFTNNDKNKLDGIEAGAEVNPYSKNQLNNMFDDKVDISKQAPATSDMTQKVGITPLGELVIAPIRSLPKEPIKVREMGSLDTMVSYDGTQQPNLTQVIEGDFVKYSNDFDYVFPFYEMEEVVDDLGNSFIKIPPIWFKFYQDVDGNLKGYDMASKKIDNDYVLFPVHQKGDLFVGKYQAHRVGNDLRSVKDVEPTMSLNIANYRDFAKNVGSKYFANDWQVWGIVRFLMTAYFGTTNSNNYFPDINGDKTNTGTMDGFKNAYNSVSGKNTFFGIENILKNGYHFIDGVINNNAEVWFNDKHETYSNTLNADYLLKGLKPTVEGYIQQYKSGIHTLPLINTGSSSKTYYADYLYYQPDFRVLLSGSSWASYAMLGVWCWNSYDVFTLTYSSIGSRLNKTS